MALIGGLAPAAAARAATIFPNTTFDETAAGGSCSLREAVQSANTNTDVGGCTHIGTYGTDAILLGGGDYDLTISAAPEDANVSGDLDVTAPLTIIGLGADQTGIDGNGAITGDRVLDVFNSGTSMSLFGVAMHGGKATAAGGGIKATAGTTLNLTNSTVSGNTTSGSFGGGIAAGTANFTNSAVNGNTAVGSGGGIAASTASLTNSTVSANTAGGFGGGIAAGTANITNSAVSDNAAASYGGGIKADTANLTGSSVSDNTATTFGGGIDVDATVHLTGSTVSANAAGGAGGGISGAGTLAASSVRRNVSAGNGGGIDTTFGDLTISRSTIAGNDANGTNKQGGGVYFAGSGTFNLVNSTLSGNEATGYGGGLSSAGGTTNLENATINRNTADADGDGNGDGGGIDQAPGATLNLKNTIVAGNLDLVGLIGGRHDCNGNADVNSQGYNLFGTTTGCGVTLVTGDKDLAGAGPLIAQLAQNGGPTLTSALFGGSPAVNAGNPATPGSGGDACSAVDQRGAHRPQGGRCDIGAFEFALPVVTIGRPRDGAHYLRGARVLASFSCREAGLPGLIAVCTGTAPNGKRINTSSIGIKSFTVKATDKAGNRTVKTVHYRVVKKKHAR